MDKRSGCEISSSLSRETPRKKQKIKSCGKERESCLNCDAREKEDKEENEEEENEGSDHRR